MTTDSKHVFVAGATGVVGLPAVRALLADGHHVSAVARTDAKAEALRAAGAEPVRVDLFVAGAVAAATSRHDVIVNLATKIPPSSQAWRVAAWAENERIRREVSTHLADAAIAHGAERYVQESLAFTYADHGHTVITEDEPIDPPAGLDGVVVAEANAARVTDAGAIGVVLRFGNFYGPDSGYTLDAARFAKRRISAALGEPGRYWSHIHSEDAGTAVAASLRAPAGTYNVVDDQPLTRAQIDEAIAEALGVKPLRHPPAPVRRALERRAEVMTRSIRASNSRFKSATGWAPAYPTAREGWAALAATFSRH